VSAEDDDEGFTLADFHPRDPSGLVQWVVIDPD